MKNIHKFTSIALAGTLMCSPACATSIVNSCDMAAVKIVFDQNGRLDTEETTNAGGFDFLDGTTPISPSLPCYSDKIIMEISFSGETSAIRLKSVWSKIDQTLNFLEKNHIAQNIHNIIINPNSQDMSRFDHDGVFISVYIAQDKVK